MNRVKVDVPWLPDGEVVEVPGLGAVANRTSTLLVTDAALTEDLKNKVMLNPHVTIEGGEFD